MALNRECFRNCVKRRLSAATWLGIGIFAVGVFLAAMFSWGLALAAAIAWAAAASGAAVGGILGFCYLNCNR
jgi:uncharacterized protein (DUF58 family)